jgi:ligand-binding sensor domain-containing protein/signal transduction histidine kinase
VPFGTSPTYRIGRANQLTWSRLSALVRLRFALVAAIALAAAPAWAIAPDRDLGACNVEIWRARDGLPSAWIRAIGQTADGYLWIGTQGGVVRYGGGTLNAIEPDHNLEHGTDIKALLASRDGPVWLIPGRGLPQCLRSEGAHDAFESCLPAASPMSSGVRIADASQDSAGVIWIVGSEGVFRFDHERLTRVTTDLPAAIASNGDGAQLTAVEHDDRGRLWIGTTAGLFVGSRQITDAPVAGIFRGTGAHLWAVADHTLVHDDGQRTEILTSREGLPSGRLTAVTADHDGNVWIGSREGLIRFQPDRPAGQRFVRFTHADGLPEDDVSDLFEDREGSLWVGTRSGGLAQFTDRTLDRHLGPPGVRDQWVGTVAEDQAGGLWVGTNRGLTWFHDGRERTFARADGLPDDVVQAVIPGRPGEIWVGTGHGLARLARGRAEPVAGYTGSVTALNLDRHAPVDESGRPPRVGAVTATDEPTGLWIGSADGLARLRLQDGKIERFAIDPSVRGVDGGDIRSVERDDQGVVWLSSNGKLLKLQGGLLARDPAPEARAIGKVRAMFRDDDGTLWLGTGDGLVRRRQGRWRLFGGAEGLGRANFFQVVPDRLGFLWIGSTQGLLRVGKASLDEIDQGVRRAAEVVSFEILDQSREVRANHTRQPGAWRSASGRLWFATTRGVVNIDPAHLHVNTVAPPVLIERALVDGRRARRGGENAFPPGSGAFEFHFAAITLLEPRKAQHRYRLEGFDADWIEAGTRRAAYYTNMRPGRYRFRVQGSNADGVWNLEGDAISLTLAPHFFQTSWFFGAVALAALALAFTVHRLRVDQLRARYAARSAERARMARELHDSLLQGMAAALMHLRGLRKRFAPDAPAAPTTTIVGEIKEIEDLVATNIEETRLLVSDLRQGRDGRESNHGRDPSDSDPDQPADVDLVGPLGDLVRRLAPASAAGGAGQSAAAVQMRVEGDPVLVPRHVQRELLRITHEALTNALKHAGAAQIEVCLSHAAASLAVSVCDDGQGFDPEAVAGVQNGHFGLTGMRERAALLGQFGLHSAPGRGTNVKVTVNLKDLRDV